MNIEIFESMKLHTRYSSSKESKSAFCVVSKHAANAPDSRADPDVGTLCGRPSVAKLQLPVNPLNVPGANTTTYGTRNSQRPVPS